jgi:peptidoglycan/LPS O-acetylase OafA/YrhL
VAGAYAVLAACLAALAGLFYAPVSHYAGAVATPQGPLWSRAGAVAWTTLARPAWAAALAGVLLLCALGRAGAVGALLAAPAWAPLSRLAFATYLIHPVVLGVTGLAARQLVDFSPDWIAGSFAQTAALATAAAALLYLFVEMPCAALQRLALEPAAAAVLAAAAAAAAAAARAPAAVRRGEEYDDEAAGAAAERKQALLSVQ